MVTQDQTVEETSTEVSIKDLLEAGVHFGHQTHRWNPKMKRYIFEERNGIHILDLAKTMGHIRVACQIARKTIEKHQSILFVGTKKQAKLVVKDCAEICGEFYVAERWLGGMLTNLSTIRQSVKKLEKIEKKITTGGEGLKKKEISQLTKLKDKLDRNLSGIRAMRKPPGLLIVIDPSREHIAVAEAKKLGIPVMAVVDTNCDPDKIDYVIAGNDDALKSNKILIQAITHAIIDKKKDLGLPVTLEEREAHAKEMREKRAAEKKKEDEIRARSAAIEKQHIAKKDAAKRDAAKKSHARAAEKKPVNKAGDTTKPATPKTDNAKIDGAKMVESKKADAKVEVKSDAKPAAKAEKKAEVKKVEKKSEKAEVKKEK